MLDFVKVRTTTSAGTKKHPEGLVTMYPEFIVGPSEDLMIRGGSFYAVWDEDTGFWSTDEGRVCNLVDRMLEDARSRYPEDVSIDVKWMHNFSSSKWSEFLKYCGSLHDRYEELDSKVIFSNDDVKKEDYATKTLPYPSAKSETPAYSELISTLYDEEERRKLEWAIGAIFCGDSTWIQKFIVLYGEAGTGKSTVLNIIEMLFEGYSTAFEAKALGQSSNAFALEAFVDNPLVAIQHDGDLSRIEDNTKLNAIVSHEALMVNEKYKRAYPKNFKSFLFMGTNRPVRITDAKSGIVRRLIEVQPSGNKIPFDRYQTLMGGIKFELGGIAYHCMRVYSSMGPNAYDNYRPLEMMSDTNDFYNFVEDHIFEFSKEDAITLKQAWAMYKEWATQAGLTYSVPMRVVKLELKGYFREYHERVHDVVSDKWLRNVYRGFRAEKFSYLEQESMKEQNTPSESLRLALRHIPSKLDALLADCPAQYAKPDGTPEKRWDSVKTRLSDIDTSKLHYVRVPENHIVIDFDIPGPNGEKDKEANLAAAAKWPETYAELSKSGCGVHLHYIYAGDPSKLSPVYEDHVEVKVYSGKSSLRRQLTECNELDVATLTSGLPEKKGGGKVIDIDGFKDEKLLRLQILKSCKKAYPPHKTKPAVDFIGHILDEAYASGKPYDVRDLKLTVYDFACNSTHHAEECCAKVEAMHFSSEEPAKQIESDDIGLIFYDVEVFPNLFVVVWKRQGDHEPVQMINPFPEDIEELSRHRLVGFNNRRYDNHILYARLMGYDNEMLYKLSGKIIGPGDTSGFSGAYGISYADIYDFCSKKQSLKKWEIELGIHHLELGLPWDEPVPKELWSKVARYCVNDVLATEAVFNARQDDYHAREMLASLSGLRVNDTNRMHTTKIIFGNDKNPQPKFIYTNLSTGERSDGTFDPRFFDGYSYEFGKSTYRGEEVGEGGYVYAEPGMYFGEIKVFDVASMHPSSARELDIFGPYTKNFTDLVDARLAIKHGDYETAGKMLGGKLKPYLGNPEDADKLAYALKIVINSVYGLTAAKFDCEFKDPRNVDNIVAKRGALFMIDLKHKVQEAGGKVIHIKTDSIKIVNPTKEVEDLVYSYGSQWGYTFEVEDVYDRICLVNDAVYIARHVGGGWTATGKQFQVPYVFKALFSHEPFIFDDYCETRSVTGTSSMFLDMDEDLGEDEHDYRFVGRAGQFTPILPGRGGGRLLREKDGKYYAIAGTKGYRWLESEVVRNADRMDDVDTSYYDELSDEAKKNISSFGDFEKFAKE